MMDRRRFLLGVGAATILATTNTALGQQQTVTIGLASGTLVASSLRIANELGLFQKRDLGVKFIVLDNANAAAAALISGSAPIIVAGPPELVVARSRGQQSVAIANVYNGLGASLVLSKSVSDKLGTAGSAPVAERLKALDGLLIAAPSPTATYKIAFDGAAKSVGAQIRFTYMAQATVVAAMDSGAIQGFLGSAPVWAYPVVKGSGVLWISGPKGEIPAAFTPSSTASVQTMHDFAEKNPEVIRKLQAILVDLSQAIDERPGEVKAAISQIYPELKGTLLDLLFESESLAWKARPLTVEDIRRDINFVRSTGAPLPQIDAVDPASMLAR